MLCESCGFKNDDKNKTCISCGKIITTPVLSDEERRAKIDGLSDKYDSFVTSKFDKIMKWVFFALAALMLVVNIIFKVHVFFIIVLLVVPIVMGIGVGYPKFMWKQNMKHYKWVFDNADDLIPSQFSYIMRRVGFCIYLVLIIILEVTLLISQ